MFSKSSAPPGQSVEITYNEDMDDSVPLTASVRISPSFNWRGGTDRKMIASFRSLHSKRKCHGMVNGLETPRRGVSSSISGSVFYLSPFVVREDEEVSNVSLANQCLKFCIIDVFCSF